jgi:hypothetical protein
MSWVVMGRQDAPGRQPGQRQQVGIAGDQRIGPPGGSQVQEGQVVRVAARRHGGRGVRHRHHGGGGQVVGQQLGLVLGRA